MLAPGEQLSLGIDPGFKNLGIALSRKSPEGEITLLETGVIIPANMERMYGSRWHLPIYVRDVWLKDYYNDISLVGIERYVPYAGVNSTEMEKVQLIIGQLVGLFYINGKHETQLYKAFDWKRDLCQHLVKTKGFQNPSEKLDKKFSIAAAKYCFPEVDSFATDHQADAACISYRNFLS